jgi:peptide/nickel transport system permease protein
MIPVPSSGDRVLARRSRRVPVRIAALHGRGRATLIAGGVLLGFIVLMALAAPLVARHSPTTLHADIVLQSPSRAHPFGTDQFGRDVFARTVYSARIDLMLAFVLVATAFLIGVTLGVIAGWVGGWFDTVLTRIIDIALAFPFLVLVISVIGMRGPGLLSLYIAVSLVAWVFYARLVREEVLRVKQMDYIRAARASDFTSRRVILRHLLPNVVVQPLVYASSDCVYALLLGASVSFLSLGVQPPQSEWGQMVAQGTPFLAAEWWISTFPGIAIVITGIAFSLIAEGLADLTRSGSSR